MHYKEIGHFLPLLVESRSTDHHNLAHECKFITSESPYTSSFIIVANISRLQGPTSVLSLTLQNLFAHASLTNREIRWVR